VLAENDSRRDLVSSGASMVVLLLDLFLFWGGGGGLFELGESANMSAIPGESGSMPMAIVISARLIEGVFLSLLGVFLGVSVAAQGVSVLVRGDSSLWEFSLSSSMTVPPMDRLRAGDAVCSTLWRCFFLWLSSASTGLDLMISPVEGGGDVLLSGADVADTLSQG